MLWRVRAGISPILLLAVVPMLLVDAAELSSSHAAGEQLNENEDEGRGSASLLGLTGDEHLELSDEDDMKPASILERLDVDKDGKLSMIEWVADWPERLSDADKNWMLASFSKADVDGDRFIAGDEMPGLLDILDAEDVQRENLTMPTENYDYLMKRFDTDRNGKLSLLELTSNAPEKELLEASFKKADANGDQFLTAEELPSLVQTLEEDTHEGFDEQNLTEESDDTEIDDADEELTDHRISPEALLDRIDADNDGKISLQEVQDEITSHAITEEEPPIEAMHDFAKSNFNQADANKDGFLTLDEIPSLIQTLGDTTENADEDENDEQSQHADNHIFRLFEHVDTDGDGRLSLAELTREVPQQDILTRALKKADVNQDKFINVEEFPTFLQSMDSAAHFLGDDAGIDDWMQPEVVLKRMDSDSDGNVSLAELLGEVQRLMVVQELPTGDKEFAERSFRSADKNADGLINLEEMPSLMEAFSEEDDA